MDCFDFMGLLRMLKEKGYELCLHPGERDEFHIRLIHWDWETGRRLNANEVVSLSAIEQYKSDPNYALCKVFLGLMERLDSRVKCFDRYEKAMVNSDDKET